MRHENLVNFVGACVEFDKVFILTSYCSKGSLQVGTMDVKWIKQVHFLSEVAGSILSLSCEKA